VKIPLIVKKIFENMAAKSGGLPLKVGEFTCMFTLSKITLSVSVYIWNHVVELLSIHINSKVIIDNIRGHSNSN
jgi:hypothetical protein